MSSETRVPLLPAGIPGFAGEVVAPGNPAFDDARAVQNDAIDRWPAIRLPGAEGRGLARRRAA